MQRLFVISFFLLSAFFCTAECLASDISELKADIISRINNYRMDKGLPFLLVDEKINAIAKEHSIKMSEKKVSFGHGGFDARFERISALFTSVSAMAENVLYGKVDGKKAVDLWLKSDGHRKNIEGKYNSTGIGISKGKDGNYYFTMIFIRK